MTHDDYSVDDAIDQLTADRPCGHCGAGSSEPCRSRNGTKLSNHGRRWHHTRSRPVTLLAHYASREGSATAFSIARGVITAEIRTWLEMQAR